MIRLLTLGGLTLVEDGVPVTGAASQRSRLALLAVLAAAGPSGISRDKVLACLWPESDDERARHALKQAVYALRRDLGSELAIVGTASLSLDSSIITSDIRDFDDAIARHDDAAAIGVYTGPFLDGVFIRSAAEFDQWAAGERARLERTHVEAIGRMARAADAAGDAVASVQWWRRAAAAEPLSGRVALALMRALAQAGDVSAAIQHARRHDAFVHAEIDSGADDAVLALAEELRRGDWTPAVRPAPARVSGGSEPPVTTSARSPDGTKQAVVAPPAQAPPYASIAVLPFRNLSADPENEYFSDGVTEEILNALIGIPALHVASRSSSFAFKDQSLTASAIAQRLNVRTILEGSLRKDGSRIRVTAQLINATTGYTLWSGRYDRELRDVFAIQEEIARTIVETLRVKLTTSEDVHLARRQTHKLEAYELYLRGRYCWHRRGMLTKSMEYFQKALESDPDYALAYHGLADGFCVLGLYAYQPQHAVISGASRAIERAVSLAPDVAEVRTSQGFLQLLAWDWAGADESFRAAIALNPNYSLAHSFYAWLHSISGRDAEADALAKRGQELEPLSPVTCGIAALVAYHSRDYERAIREGELALEIEPSSFLPLLAITLSHAAMGNYPAAIETGERGIALSPDAMFLRGPLGAAYGMAGQRDKALGILDDFDQRSATTYIAPILRAWIHFHIDQPELAFASLEAAYSERSGPLGLGVRFPIYDGIREDPRFADLLKRMHITREHVSSV